MSEDFSSAASAAFSKLSALKRRYQQEPDPVPALEQAVQIEPAAADHDDIPVLTEAVLILDEAAAETIDVVEPLAPPEPATAVSVEDELVERVVARLRPELERVIVQSVQAALEGQNPAIYQAWLAGLRQRTRQLLDGEEDTSVHWP